MKAIKITNCITQESYYGKSLDRACKASGASAYSIRNKKAKHNLPFVIGNFLIEEIYLH